MKCLNLILFILLLPLLSPQHTKAQEKDSVSLSLITCGAGDEIYSLFGHTAIRYKNTTKGIDYAFNYGIFSFNTPNFIWRFTLGETDYILGVQDFKRFVDEYTFLGRSVREQELNLNDDEKTRLTESLFANAQPENRTYRYNFFFDNCATKPRDKVENCLDGTIIYKGKKLKADGKTFRDLIHEYSHNSPWSTFGIDLCLGKDADIELSEREAMFVPFYLEDYFSGAVIIDRNGVERSLVSGEKTLIEDDGTDKTSMAFSTIITPFRLTLLMLICILALTINGIKHRKTYWAIDLFMFAIAGIAGCVLAFLALFSQHPAVGNNYLLIIFHPAHLLLLPFFINKVRQAKRSVYMALVFVILVLFITFWPTTPQKINLAILPLALCMIIRSASNIILSHKQQK